MKKRINWQKLLLPDFPISAISFEDRIVRVFGFNKKINKVNKVGRYILPQGVIEEGILRKPQILRSFLLSVKRSLWPKSKKVWVILSLPSNNFFTNIFTLPELPESQLQDAIIFNTQMVTPVPLEESYFDWEDWGSSPQEGNKEIFIAIGIKKQIQPFIDALESSGFQVVAVEPLAISLARFVGRFLDDKNPVLAINIRNDGVEFIVSEGEKVIYFDYDSWPEIFGSKIPSVITLQHLEKHLTKEIPLILNFYILKRKNEIKQFICFSENNNLVTTISNWIQNNYHLLPMQFKLPPYLKSAGRSWAPVIGAAIRGLIPRATDTIVSLAPIGTEEIYARNHFLSVLSLWLKIIMVVLASITATLGIVHYVYFQRILDNYRIALIKPLNPQTQSKYNEFRVRVKEFNDLVQAATAAQKSIQKKQQYIEEIFQEANKNSVVITRLFITKNITIQGIAKNKAQVIKYRKALEQSSLFKQVSLPLESIVDTPEGTNFALSLEL